MCLCYNIQNVKEQHPGEAERQLIERVRTYPYLISGVEKSVSERKALPLTRAKAYRLCLYSKIYCPCTSQHTMHAKHWQQNHPWKQCHMIAWPIISLPHLPQRQVAVALGSGLHLSTLSLHRGALHTSLLSYGFWPQSASTKLFSTGELAVEKLEHTRQSSSDDGINNV